MRSLAEGYFREMAVNIAGIRVTGAGGESWGLGRGVEEACGLIDRQHKAGGQLFFIGNGGSAAIASHMSADFFKRGGINAQCFNDPALLTCLGNDLGFALVFETPLLRFVRPGDLLVAISSSGKSENILRGAAAARSRGGKVVTLSGFDPQNPLSRLGEVNFFVPSSSYGQVEVLHHSLCHCLLDTLVAFREGKEGEGKKVG